MDSFGFHHNRKADGYHCHRGSLAGGQVGPQAAAYDREDYLHRLADADDDCQDTRQEVLKLEDLLGSNLLEVIYLRLAPGYFLIYLVPRCCGISWYGVLADMFSRAMGFPGG